MRERENPLLKRGDKGDIMGTNFYMHTRDKRIKDYAPYSYKVVDLPDFGYEIHIGKTSAGWLPLFEEHHLVKSIRDYKKLYNLLPDSAIYDEYGDKYTWTEFVERVLEFNGGVQGVKDKVLIENTGDSDMPPFAPVSHFEYGSGKYSYMYYKDPDGYEFSHGEFS